MSSRRLKVVNLSKTGVSCARASAWDCPLQKQNKKKAQCFSIGFELKSGSSLGSTGRIRFPNEESCVMKNPVEWTWACCRAAFCWAAMCCCSALSRTSFRLGLDDSGMLAPGLFIDWFWIRRLFSLSSSARMAARAFWKPGAGGLAAMSS